MPLPGPLEERLLFGVPGTHERPHSPSPPTSGSTGQGFRMRSRFGILPAMQILLLSERPQHLDTVSRWIWGLWHGHSGLSEAQTRDRLLDPPDCPPTLLAEEEDKPAGVLAFHRIARAPGEPPSLFIDALFVAEPLRGRGIGAALVREGVERARSFAPDLYVYTSQRDDWYQRHGWSLLRVDPVSGLIVLTRAT